MVFVNIWRKTSAKTMGIWGDPPDILETWGNHGETGETNTASLLILGKSPDESTRVSLYCWLDNTILSILCWFFDIPFWAFWLCPFYGPTCWQVIGWAQFKQIQSEQWTWANPRDAMLSHREVCPLWTRRGITMTLLVSHPAGFDTCCRWSYSGWKKSCTSW